MVDSIRTFSVENYTDFKEFVTLFGSTQYILWAYSAGNYSWIMNINPVNNVVIVAQNASLILNSATIASDFPNAVEITTSDSATQAGSGFTTVVYNEWKTVLSTINVGGPILYSPAGSNDFVVALYGADPSWTIRCYSSVTPSSFSTDFPNAIQVDYHSIG